MKLYEKTSNLLLLLSFIILAVPARGGEGTGNGGGGNSVQTMYTTNLAEQLRGLTFAENFQNLASVNKDLRVYNCSSGSFIPLMPAKYDNYFKFYKLNVRGAIKFAFGKRAATTELNSKNLNILCESPLHLDAYGTFVVTLLEALQSDDIVVQKLIEEAFKIKGSIEILIANRGVKIQMVGKKELQTRWFDNVTGRLGWAYTPACEGPECLIARAKRAALRHELAHVLMFRIFGDNYPKEKVWHDTRFPNPFNPIRQKTSQNAAFIEGFANAMETGYVHHHPHSMSDDASYYGYVYMHKDIYQQRNIYCHAALSRWITVKYIKAFKASEIPLDNEPYITRTLVKLVEDYIPGGIVEMSSKEFNYVVNNPDPQLVNLIDALIAEAPTNIFDLGKAYDHTTGTDLGRRWLKEFYLYDYIDNKDISNEFDSEGCMSVEKAYAGYFSPYKEGIKKQQEKNEQ